MNNALRIAVILNNIFISILRTLKIKIENIAEDTMNTAFKMLFAATTRARCDRGEYACIMAYKGTI